MIKYLLFDVAGTLLWKPQVYKNIQRVLHQNNFKVDLKLLQHHHRLLSEFIQFPDQTGKEFYEKFNAALLLSLGILPSEKLLHEIFTSCDNLAWEKYQDTDFLQRINLPKGILSNFNHTLKEKIDYFFEGQFRDVFVSEEMKVAKPEINFYQKAISLIGLRPEEILYIGDSMRLDMEPAKKVGMNILLIDRDHVFASADFRIDTLTQILDQLQ